MERGSPGSFPVSSSFPGHCIPLWAGKVLHNEFSDIFADEALQDKNRIRTTSLPAGDSGADRTHRIAKIRVQLKPG
jgi:hypothetical protein